MRAKYKRKHTITWAENPKHTAVSAVMEQGVVHFPCAGFGKHINLIQPKTARVYRSD